MSPTTAHGQAEDTKGWLDRHCGEAPAGIDADGPGCSGWMSLPVFSAR